jgi:hypothetical protein
MRFEVLIVVTFHVAFWVLLLYGEVREYLLHHDVIEPI